MRMLLGSTLLDHPRIVLARHAAVVASRGLVAKLPAPAPLRHRPELVWISVISDSLVAAGYAVMLACMVYLAVRLRRMKDFQSSRWVVLWFGTLIMGCGASKGAARIKEGVGHAA